MVYIEDLDSISRKIPWPSDIELINPIMLDCFICLFYVMCLMRALILLCVTVIVSSVCAINVKPHHAHLIFLLFLFNIRIFISRKQFVNILDTCNLK